MSYIEINKKDYFLAEIKSWLRALVSILVIVALAITFLDFEIEKRWLIITVPLVITIANTITQYHIHAISVEKDTNILVITLRSIMSGSKTQNFTLDKVKVNLVQNSGLKSIFYGPLVLKILVNDKDIFRITKRYGFTADNLKIIEDKLRSSKIDS